MALGFFKFIFNFFLLQISDASGSMKVSSVAPVSPFKQAMLSPEECYILDNGVDRTIFVWKGEGSITGFGTFSCCHSPQSDHQYEGCFEKRNEHDKSMLWTCLDSRAESAAVVPQNRQSLADSHARAPCLYQNKTTMTSLPFSR